MLARMRRRIIPARCRTRKLRILLVSVLLLLVLLRPVLLGRGPTLRGGEIGRTIDLGIKRYLFYRHAVPRHQQRFWDGLGYELPATAEQTANSVGTPVLLGQWLSETLLRAKARHELQQEAMQAATLTTLDNCRAQNVTYLWHPLVGEWYQAPSKLERDKRIRVVSVDESEMEHWLQKSVPWLYNTVYWKLSQSHRVQLWGLCMVARFGGIFVSPQYDAVDWNQLAGVATDCSRPRLLLQAQTDQNVHLVAARPNDSRLACAFNELKAVVAEKRTCGPQEFWSELWRLLVEDAKCPLEQHASILPPWTPRVETTNETPRFSVSVVEAPGTSPWTVRSKKSWRQRLQELHCSPGWFCNRCLRMPWRGTFKACRSFCRPCYEQNLCHEDDGSSTRPTTTTLQVQVNERRGSSDKRIPRIIHQTWFEELTTKQYPHLQRLQNSWKAAGWEYRFYDDARAEAYIRQHFPDRVLQAYNAIVPGAFKADLFRLLVLLQDGGVYADFDVQLEANLDAFITSELSFFVPRDVAIDLWPKANYCLWNGLMGSSPGHPILAQALEDVLNRVLHRQDYYDMESQICRHDANAEIWKLRIFPILLVTGPCALGASVNAALDHTNVAQGFDLGWLPPVNTTNDAPYGDGLILLTDRYDLGELRFTDVDRSLLIASSNQEKFARSAIERLDQRKGPAPAHYSKAESDIVGERGTYKDDQVADERIRIEVVHSFV